jgi:hypothetical protein
VEKTLTVTDRTGTREITMEEALQQQTYQRALAGVRMAVREVLKWIAVRDEWLVRHGPKAWPPAITRQKSHASKIARSRQCGCRSPAARDRGS